LVYACAEPASRVTFFGFVPKKSDEQKKQPQHSTMTKIMIDPTWTCKDLDFTNSVMSQMLL
jgi:hypothetical protein